MLHHLVHDEAYGKTPCDDERNAAIVPQLLPRMREEV